MKLRKIPQKLKAAPDRLRLGADSWRADKGSTARGYGYAWQRARADYLLLHPLCRLCQARGVVAAATVVDHVIPHRGNMILFWDRNNWQPLCTHCHASEKQRQERDQDNA